MSTLKPNTDSKLSKHDKRSKIATYSCDRAFTSVAVMYDDVTLEHFVAVTVQSYVRKECEIVAQIPIKTNNLERTIYEAGVQLAEDCCKKYGDSFKIDHAGNDCIAAYRQCKTDLSHTRNKVKIHFPTAKKIIVP